MKKIAITLSAATLLMGALVGCGVDQQGTGGLGTRDQRGFGYHATDTDTNVTGQRAGEGPITDMFTRDDRRGARGFGRDARRPATGLAGERTGTGLGAGGAAGQFGGGMRGTGTGLGAGGTGAGGAAGQFGGGMRGTGTGLGTGGTGAGGAAGQFGGGMRGTGTGLGTGGAGIGAGHHGGMRGTGFGRTGTDGVGGLTQTETSWGTFDTGTRARGAGGTTGFGAGRTDDRYGVGVVGNRPGYVDNRGILRDRTTGFGHGGTHMGGTTGIGTQGFGTTNRYGANGRSGDRVVPGSGMREFAYPSGYDANTVNRLTTRLADVENVRDSRVILHGNRVLVGVDTDHSDTNRVQQDVHTSLRGMVGNREVIVVTDRDQYNQVRTADDRLRAGEAFDEVGATINDMFHDFGRALQRPFQRSR